MRRFAAVVIVVIFSIGIARVWAQISESPPQVVYLSPTDDIPLDSPLTLMFNQVMNRQSVEAGWSITPSIEGTFSWKNDFTLIFTPSQPWQRDTAYTVSIGQTAVSAANLALPDPYTATIQTVRNLHVTSVQPADNATEVLADAAVIVAFSSPVVPLVAVEDMGSLPDPLVIEPAIAGHGEWLNTFIYQFTPDQPWSGGTTYTVTAKAGLTTLSGAPLTDDYQWHFTTTLPQIVSVYPYQGATNVELNAPITVSFSQPMDHAATESSVHISKLGQDVRGTFTWTDDSTQLTFTPSGLDIASTYQLLVDKAVARSVSGAMLTEGYSAFFQTIPLPYVSNVYPNSDYVVYPGMQTLQISFATPMDVTSLKDAVTISPQTEDVTPLIQDTYISYSFEFLPQTQYTITVSGSVRDVYGNALGKDYTSGFMVQDVPAVESDVDLAVWQRFIVTGSYRQNTSIALRTAGDPSLSLSLYQIPTEHLWDSFSNFYYNTDVQFLVNESTLVRSWMQRFTPATDYAYMRLNLAGEQGGQLPSGVYLLQGMEWPIVVAVTNSNITVKSSPNELVAWVTDMQTGAPLANQAIAIYDQTQLLREGVTDDQGIVHLPMDSANVSSWLTVVSHDEDHYGVWRSYASSQTPSHDLYLYTDRPIYRPGETLYYRGVYRQRDDMHFFVGAPNSLQITITDNRGTTLLDEPVQLNEMGSFSGEVKLGDDVATGQLYISVRETTGDSQSWYSYAQVAEYRVPEYKVGVTAETPEVANGSEIRALVNASYFSGGSVSSANLSWTATSTLTTFNYTGEGRYNFIDWQDYDYYSSPRQIASDQTTTDANGSFMIDVPDVHTSSSYPEYVTLEASISDESGQSISGRDTVLLHSTDAYIGLHTDTYFGEEKKPFTADVIAVAPDSTPIANKSITLTLTERRWSYDANGGWTSEDLVADSIVVTTGQDGKASHEFTPPGPGLYTVKAATTDYHSSVQMYVSGTSRFVQWGNQEKNTLTLLPDKDTYTAGETAEIFMQIPFEGTSYALITVERQGVMQQEVVRVEGSNLLYHLPITEAYEPGVFVSVMMVHGIDASSSAPAYAQQTIQLNVEPVSKRLNITIRPSTTNAKPGDVVTFDILATDASGLPVKAEFGLQMVDAAILSLTGDNSENPESHYYGSVSDQISTDTLLTYSLDQSQDDLFGSETINEVAINVTATPRPPLYAPGQNQLAATSTASGTQTAQSNLSVSGAAGGDATVTDGLMREAAEMPAAAPVADADRAAPGSVEVRSDFQQTPLWAAHVMTDEQGHAQVSVTMPDNLTIWSLTARAITADTRIGEVKLDVASTLPLLVRPVVPRFFVVGDEASIGMVINNNTDDVQDVAATIRGSGFTFVGNLKDTQSTLIQPHSRARIDWRVKILDVEAVDLTFIAVGNNGYQDASKPPLSDDGKVPVYRYTAPETVGTAGVLREAGSRTEGIVIPDIADTNQGSLTVKIDHSLAATTLDSLDYLANYPHQCIEQTVSRFLPNLITHRALQTLNADQPELDSRLNAELDDGLKRLINSQNYDGGWGWFPQMESSPYVSAYALLGLIEARTSGYDVPETTITNAVLYLRQQIIYPGIDTNEWQLNQQAFYFYVLSRDSASNVTSGEMDSLFAQRVEMSYAARAYLLMAYVTTGGSDQIQALKSDLLSNAHLSATGAHWEETYVDWWNWGSDVRSTSVALMALLQVDPQNEILPNVVRWLMVARQGDHWQSTQETTWAIMSLTDWMAATHELEANYSYKVMLNDSLEGQGVVVPDNVREGDTLTFAVQDLLHDEMNRLTIEHDGGQGALYYTAHLNLELDASQVGALDRGMSVSREYLINDKPVSEVSVGDVVTVRLTLTVPETVYYAVVESPLPAGTEAVDKSLLTTAQAGGTDNDPYGYNNAYDYYDFGVYSPRFWWGWWVWDHTDIRDESVNLYADVIYPGTYVYSYEVRASVAGRFQVMPTQAYAFYFPEVFGRSDGALFTVK